MPAPMRVRPMQVRLERDGDVAVAVIDNPPVNAGSHAVRAGLVAAVGEAAADPGVAALVLIGAGTTFVAGADIKEFGQPAADPQLFAVVAAIEACPKPVVAALRGAALGGGLELALGCDARVAAPGTRLGLPEVTLGLIPGAGGTQRLPRLVGVPRAMDLIARGALVGAAEARELGLVDLVATGDLRAAAVAHARALGGKRRVRDLSVPESRPDEVEAAAGAARRAGRERPAVLAAIEAVASAPSLPIDEGLARERAAFQGLRASREARALRHLFFAEREAAKVPGLDGVAPREVARIAVVGAGTRGAGMAIAALDAGLDVALLDRDAAALDRAVARLRDHYRGEVAQGTTGVAEAEARLGRLSPGLDWGPLDRADLVIEAVSEDLGVKRDVFRRIDEAARPGAVLATSTSVLDLDAIAQATGRPGDVLGLHVLGPAHVTKLLEVVRGRETAPDVLATGLALARRLRKVPVVARNAPGLVGNRVEAACRRQCEVLLAEGASPREVDGAMEAFGFAREPFAVGDLPDLDAAWRMRGSQDAERDPVQGDVTIPDRLAEAGRQSPEAGEIVERALLAMVNEAALLLAEGVAQRAGDVDAAMVNGCGFPRWEGGPLFWARERGPEALSRDLDRLAEASGPGFVRGDARWALGTRE